MVSISTLNVEKSCLRKTHSDNNLINNPTVRTAKGNNSQ